MPFTITHTAAILPLTRLAPQLPLSALAIGSMLPDAPIFFSLGYGYNFLHSMLGLLFATIPVGLVAYWLFHRHVKAALVSLAPDWISGRLNGDVSKHPDASLLLVSTSLMIGASSHIMWDLFTHKGLWGVEILPFLQANYSIANHEVAGYKIVQHGSSILFLPLIATLSVVKLSKLPIVEMEQPLPKMRRVTQTCIAVTPLLSSLIVWSRSEAQLMRFLFETTVLTGMLMIISIATYSLLLNSNGSLPNRRPIERS